MKKTSVIPNSVCPATLDSARKLKPSKTQTNNFPLPLKKWPANRRVLSPSLFKKTFAKKRDQVLLATSLILALRELANLYRTIQQKRTTNKRTEVNWLVS